MTRSRVAAVVGIGPGNGRALTEKFAAEGYQVAMLSRSGETLAQYENEVANAHGFVCDATDREGIHVGYVVIDGVVESPGTREKMPDKPKTYFLDPADIALSVFNLVTQPRSAWSFELDVRPYGEAC